MCCSCAGRGVVSDTIGSAVGCCSVAFAFGCAGRCSLQSHHTPHTTSTTLTPHTTRHSFLRICKSEMYALCSMPGMHSSARSSSTNISNAIHPSKVKLSYTKSYPHKYNYKDTHKDAHKYATTDTTSAMCTKTTIPYTHHKNAHKTTPTNTLTAELLCPCYHVTW